jgi:hypothetical protein
VGGLSQRQDIQSRPRGEEKQARKGLVFPFQPDPAFECCKKKRCAQFFTEAGDLRAKEARKPLFDPLLDREALRKRLRQNWARYLTIPSGETCCKKMMLKIYNCSSSLIYGDHRKDDADQGQGDSNSNRTQKAVNIASWFHTLKETADVMPDEGWYQIDTPKRSMVFADYNNDAEESGEYLPVKSKSYFYSVWDDNFPEVRLRRHCRFAKCDFCVHWRTKAQDRATLPEARARLRAHRAWANVRERGYWHAKVTEAKTDPDKALSISIDGMIYSFSLSTFSPIFFFFFFFSEIFTFLCTQNQERINSHMASRTSGRAPNKTKRTANA